MSNPNNPNPPLFDGQPIFGDLPSFATQLLIQGRPVDVDNWLGLTPGTTLYGADLSGGQLYGVTGAFIASSVPAVEALQAKIQSYAGLSCLYGYPMALKWPDNWLFWPNCYFELAEYVPSTAGIVAAPGNMYSLSYKLVIRRTGS